MNLWNKLFSFIVINIYISMIWDMNVLFNGIFFIIRIKEMYFEYVYMCILNLFMCLSL